ncbi:MAG TPA: hypothetical protein VN259_06245 [Xanthomonadales bacterium]|nr:hypothetical protein [Xanthomonadales bacterium]
MPTLKSKFLVAGCWLLAARAGSGLLVVGSWLFGGMGNSCGVPLFAANNQEPATNNRFSSIATNTNNRLQRFW